MRCEWWGGRCHIDVIFLSFGHILIFHVIALLVTLVSFEDHASVINCPCSLTPPVKVSPFPLCFSVSGDVNMGF